MHWQINSANGLIIKIKLKKNIVMKKKIVFSLLIVAIAFGSCKKSKEQAIYVKYNWTANLEYYSDDIPVTYTAGEANAREYQGPVPMATYNYRYKLFSENTERSGTIILVNPPSTPDGGNRRKYLIGIYNSNMEITFIDE